MLRPKCMKSMQNEHISVYIYIYIYIYIERGRGREREKKVEGEILRERKKVEKMRLNIICRYDQQNQQNRICVSFIYHVSIRGLFEEQRDWYLKKIISIQNNKLHDFPF